MTSLEHADDVPQRGGCERGPGGGEPLVVPIWGFLADVMAELREPGSEAGGSLRLIVHRNAKWRIKGDMDWQARRHQFARGDLPGSDERRLSGGAAPEDV